MLYHFEEVPVGIILNNEELIVQCNPSGEEAALQPIHPKTLRENQNQRKYDNF
jgi:hypothetical protein